MMNILEYDGILIISAVIIAILFYSDDLECVMLMTGIIVNIIAICLNTGVTHLTDKKTPKSFLPVKRFDLLDKILNKKGLKNKDSLDEKKSVDRPFNYNRYPGAVNWDEDEMYQETGSDMIPDLSVKHQGINSQRQISGSTKRRKVLQPYIAAELTDVENLPWWGQMDY